jgi:hypothetical protein
MIQSENCIRKAHSVFLQIIPILCMIQSENCIRKAHSVFLQPSCKEFLNGFINMFTEGFKQSILKLNKSFKIFLNR